MLKIRKILLSVITVLQLTGCVSAFNSQEQLLTVTCTTTDADIFINQKKYANPAQVLLPRDKYVSVRVEKDGYTPYNTQITTALSGCGVTDAISALFLLVPAIGLLTPGAYELVTTDLTVKLYKAH